MRRNILTIIALMVVVFLCACQGATAAKEYKYYFLAGTTGVNAYIIEDEGKYWIEFDKDSSNRDAVESLHALKWNVLYPNSEGKIIIIGTFDSKTYGLNLEADTESWHPGKPKPEPVGLFRLEDWYLNAPFEYWYADEEIDPSDIKKRIKPSLDKDDFNTDIDNPARYNRFIEVTTTSLMIDKGEFIGQPVGRLLLDMEAVFIDYYYIDEPPGKLRGAGFVYPDGLTVDVYVDELRHLSLFNENRDWDLELFKKELISDIEIRKYEELEHQRASTYKLYSGEGE